MKVTEFEGHKVPEGATKYQPDSGRFHESFWDDNGNVWVIGIAERWVRVGSLIPQDLIELPAQQEDNAEWVPTGRCVHIYGGGMATRQEKEVTIVGIDKDGFYVFQNDKSTRYYSDPASEFRPLKTDEQKAKEAFKAAVCKAIHESDSTYNDRLSKITEVLFYAGFTAPEGEL
jgi:hypothetical protein